MTTAFSVPEWALFVALFAWMRTPAYKADGIAYERYGRRSRGFFFLLWGVLHVLQAISLFYWLRDRDGRDGKSYPAVGFLALLSSYLAESWAPLFFGRHAMPRDPADDKMYQKGAFVIGLLLFGQAAAVTVIQLVAYAGGAPNDVTIAFWTYLPYTVWLLVALVWTGMYAFGSRALAKDFLHPAETGASVAVHNNASAARPMSMFSRRQ